MNNDASIMPPLSRLRPFEAAARHESFSKAADELGMTQTAISKQIGQLEQELGTKLFERRNRAVFLTKEGRRLGQVTGTALADIAAEIALLKGVRRSTELVLHCQLCEAFYWLMPRLPSFHQRHPGVELRVVSSLNPLTEAAEAFDVALQSTGRASGTARLAFTVPDDIFPVCSPDLVAKSERPIEPDALSALPLLSHLVVPQDWLDWPGWFQSLGHALPKRRRLIEFDSYPLALQAAVAGQGVALGWRRTTEGLIKEGKLVRPCKEFVSRPNELSVFRGSARTLHADADKLIAWMADELAG